MENKVQVASNFASPADVADDVVSKIGVGKANASWFNLLVLGILAGGYIGLGAAIATLVSVDAAKYVGLGLSKCIMGAVFSVGLMLVVIAGAELFTGNNLMLASVLGKKTGMTKLFRNWTIVYFANLIGAIMLAVMMLETGLWKTSNLAVGIEALAIANAKVQLPFFEAFFRAICCNWLVCLAVWMMLASRDVTGKIFAAFFPIMTFVALGFEHSVANMYFIPMGLFLKTTVVAEKSGLDLTGLTWTNFVAKNLIPVTIGNVIGGSIFVAFLYWSVYHRNSNKTE